MRPWIQPLVSLTVKKVLTWSVERSMCQETRLAMSFSSPDGDIRNGACGTDTYTRFAAIRPAIANKSKSLSKTIEYYSLATTNVYRKDLLAFLHIF